MAINLSNLTDSLLSHRNVSNTSSQEGTSSIVRLDANGNGLELRSGQIISGEVTSVDGNLIELKLGNQTIAAKLEAGINILAGQTLSFEVNKTANDITALRPLYANLSQNLSITNALKEASMPLTSNNMRMVMTMMEEGMSVSKNSLWDMFKSVSQNQGVDIATSVQLTKLGLPVDEITAGQFENYKNFQHQIVKDVNNLTDGMTQLFREGVNFAKDDYSLAANVLNLVERDDSKIGEFLVRDMFNGFSDEMKMEFEQLFPKASMENEAISLSNSESLTDKSEGLAAQGETDIKESNNLVSNNSSDIVNSEAKNEGNIINRTVNDLINGVKDLFSFDKNSGQPIVVSAQDLNVFAREESILSDKDRMVLAKDFGDLGFDKQISERIIDGTIGDKDILQFAKGVVNNLNNEAKTEFDFSSLKEKFDKILTSDPFRKILSEEYSKQFLLNPKDSIDKNKVDELYKRILENTNEAMRILSENGKASSPAMKSAQNMSDNVNFMNQLNQLLQYVQLPLRMGNENTHGELYVYTKKKNLMKKDGSVSALLHLDMDHLGPMDVYVALNNQKVNTHFYMRDEATLDFIEANIHLLDERLTKKGYDMTATVTTKEGASESMASEFLKQEAGKRNPSISKLSFDVRA